MHPAAQLHYFAYSRISIQRMQTGVLVMASILTLAFIGIGVRSWVANPSIALFALPLMTALGLITAALMVGITVAERPRYEAMRIGIGPDVIQRVFRTTTEEFPLHTFHRIRVVHHHAHHVRKIQLYRANNTAITIMDFDHMNDLYELLLRYLPPDIPRDVVIQRFDIAQPPVIGVISVLAISGYFVSASVLGPSMTDGLLGIFFIIAACTMWIQQPSTRINPEFKWLERVLVILFLFLGFSRLLQAFF